MCVGNNPEFNSPGGNIVGVPVPTSIGSRSAIPRSGVSQGERSIQDTTVPGSGTDSFTGRTTLPSFIEKAGPGLARAAAGAATGGAFSVLSGVATSAMGVGKLARETAGRVFGKGDQRVPASRDTRNKPDNASSGLGISDKPKLSPVPAFLKVEAQQNLVKTDKPSTNAPFVKPAPTGGGTGNGGEATGPSDKVAAVGSPSKAGGGRGSRDGVFLRNRRGNTGLGPGANIRRKRLSRA